MHDQKQALSLCYHINLFLPLHILPLISILTCLHFTDDHVLSRWREVMDNVDLDGITPMRKLIRSAPMVAEEVLDRCITKSKHPTNHDEYNITYDFRYIDQDPSDDKADSCSFEAATMAKYNRENLLGHPATKKLMAYKWARLGRVVYYSTLFLYLIFVACVTSVVVVQRER